MQRVMLALVWLLVPLSAAAGGSFPFGSGSIEFKEKFKVSGGCGGFKDVAVLLFTAHGDGTFTASAPAGTFSGTLTPKDEKGLKWLLAFDSGSLADYVELVEDYAGDLCGTAVTASFLEFKKFEVKFKKDLSEVKVKLKVKGEGSTAFGSGKAKHSLSGKGPFSAGD